MKIITVAAGAGSRLSNLSQLNFGINLPKPLYPVLGKPMVYWSYKSFANWITLGLVKPSDFIFVVRKDHEQSFGITSRIKDVTHPNVQFQLVDKLTSGPAETALLAIKQATAKSTSEDSKKSSIDKSEGIIINDCDHYFNASTMLYELISNESQKNFDVFLSYTKPRRSTTNWSCIQTGSKRISRALEVMKIVEKDPKLLSDNKGIIGAYYFSNINLFEDLYKEITNLEGEKYISKLVDLSIKRKLKVFATQAKFGFPLGTEEDIIDFEAAMSGKSLHQFKVNTYFVDIDGVLLQHDSGFHSREERYRAKQTFISSNIEQLMAQYLKGDRIVLTTSRPESERADLIKLFSSIDFKFDHLIMGIGDGIRLLINDRKTTDSYIDTAVAINVPRNKPYTLTNLAPKFMGDDVNADLTSGSGAYTLKISDPSKTSVIKKIIYFPSLNPEPTFILSIQKKWYESVKQILPNNIPKVYSFTQSEDFVSLEMEDISPSRSLNQIIYSAGLEDISQTKPVVNSFIQCLYEMYSRTGRPQINDRSAELEYFIVNKSIPGIESLFKSANFAGLKWNQSNEKLEINGVRYDNPLQTLQQILNQVQDKKLKKYGLSSSIEAHIHGDLTGENVLVKSDNSVFLIDPLSTYLCPQKRINNELSISQTTVTYDFIKILQSFLAGYENWASSTTSTFLDGDQSLFLDESLAINSTNTHIKAVLDMYENFGVNTSERNINLLGALMLFRLIPYRLLVNEASALYCLGLGTLMLERIL